METKENAVKEHKQVLIKVNAECDEGVAPVVIADYFDFLIRGLFQYGLRQFGHNMGLVTLGIHI
jgi:hypothetical protein